MITAYICLLISIFIPLTCAGYAKFSVKGYNNKTPREFLAGLEGRARRADFAQNNFYETFPAFAVGVLACDLAEVQGETVALLAVVYVTARVVYALAYIADRAALRSAAWFVAFSAIVTLYIQTITALL